MISGNFWKSHRNIPVFESDLWQLFKIIFQSLFNLCSHVWLHGNTNLHKYKNSFDSSNDRLNTKILSHVNLQLSQKLQLPDQATRILNLVARTKFLVAPASRQPLMSSPVTLCLDLVAPFIFVMHTGGGGISQMGQQGWSGAGQRDYHYSLYNKRKFEEVWWAHA